ncbi:MAG: imidazole glycerol phosphate synthase subunit HisH [Rhodothermales bacterium]|nr:imidazole glycerol phosphate synthase subunit HisH [Rhodothermales bacterium]MBO6781076.1 imidazole glycerol phosphate synthase subunit HisH [Rhodothermales bacterium]
MSTPAPTAHGPVIGIVETGLSNLFSVRAGLEHCGARPIMACEPDQFDDCAGLVLPGVGSFPDAMAELDRTGMADAVRSAVRQGLPVFGICLGQQLLLESSGEFSTCRGLGVLRGTVQELDSSEARVPNMGWRRLEPGPAWHDSPLEGLDQQEPFYFVHSFAAAEVDPSTVAAYSRHGSARFPAAFSVGSLFATQFHPEKSGPAGLRIYRHWIEQVTAHV